MTMPRRIIGSYDSEAVRAEKLDAYQARKKAGIVPAEPEWVERPTECGRCITHNHEACDGGAWDLTMRPVPCRCSMEDHKPTRWGGSAVISGIADDVEADRRGAMDEDRRWTEHGGAA